MAESSEYWARFWQRRIDRRGALRGGLGGLAGLAALGLAACGGNSNNNKSSNANSSNSSAGATKAAASAAAAKTSTATGGLAPLQGTAQAGGALALPKPDTTAIPLANGQFGGKFNLATTLEPTTLDPLNAISGGDYVFGEAMYDFFVAIRHFTLDLDHSLAQSFELVDPEHITFHLRPGIKFHDGSDFDAANYQWNMQRLQNPANKGVSLGQLSDIDHIDTPDAMTANMVLKQPNAAIFNSLAAYTAVPVSRQAVEKYGDKFKSNPVGTGPFTFVEWVTGSHVTVKKNPNYWMKDGAGKQLPYLDQVTMTVIPDPNTQFANLQSGTVDYSGIGSLNLLDPASKDPNLVVVQGIPGSSVASVIAFNTIKAPLDNVNLRKAFAFALDADAVNRTVYFGKYQIGKDAMITPGGWAYQDTPGRPTFDQAQAKQFLATGGQPNGFSVDMVVYNSPTINQQAELYQANLKQIGINANIVTEDVGAATNDFFQDGKFAVYSTAWGGTDYEPNVEATLVYQSNAVYNPMHKEVTPGLDALIAKARQTFDTDQRKQMYAQIDDAVLNQACFFIPMVLATPYAAFRKNIGGIEAWPDIGVARLQFLWNKGS